MIESFLQMRSKPLSSLLHWHLQLLLGRWGATTGRLHFLSHLVLPSPILLNEKYTPGAGKTDLMCKSHSQEGLRTGSEGKPEQGAREISGVWGRNCCWERSEQMRRLKQPDLGENGTSGTTNTFFYSPLHELSNKVKINHSCNQCAILKHLNSLNLGQVGQSGG